MTDAEKYYQEALAGCDVLVTLREAEIDLDDFLTIFPEHALAADMRQRLDALLSARGGEL